MNKESRSHSDCSESRFGSCDAATSTISDFQAVAIGWNDGRRLYIHQSAFDGLALQSASAAELTYSALVALPVVKLVHHDVVEEGVALGLVQPITAGRIRAVVDEAWLPRISAALRQMFLEDRPLIAQDESIAATCVDANYFTFATGEGAARRMYADSLKLSEVWKLVQARGDLYRDVTMVKGRRLSVAPAVSHEAGTAFDIEKVKHAIMQQFLVELELMIAASSPRSHEISYLNEFGNRCSTVVRVMILRLGRRTDE